MKKAISWLLVWCMVLTFVPFYPRAEEGDTTGTEDKGTVCTVDADGTVHCAPARVEEKEASGSVQLMAGQKLADPTNLRWETEYKEYEEKIIDEESGEETSREYQVYPGWLSWDDKLNETSHYRVSIYDTNGTVVHNTRWSVEATQTGYHKDDFLIHVEESGTYRFGVQAINDNDESLNSNEVFSSYWTYVKPSKTLSTPTGLSFDGTYLNWTSSSDADGAFIDFYYSKTKDGEQENDGSSWSRHRTDNCYMLEKFWYGAGYYHVRVRSLSNDITKICNSAYSDYITIYYDGSSAQGCDTPTPGGGQESKPVPVYSYSEEEALEAALTQVNLASMLPGITSGMDKLRGPYISFAGKDFYLFEIEAALDIDLGKKGSIQVKADVEKKTIQVLIGYEPLGDSMTIVGDPNSHENKDTDFWKTYADAKNLYKLLQRGSPMDPAFRSKFQNAYDYMQEFEMDMIVSAKGRISGYIELSYETGQIQFSEGGAILAVTLDTTINGRVPSFPAAYVTFRLGLSGQGSFPAVLEQNKVIFDPQFEFALSSAVGVGLGDNTGKFQGYVEGGFEGKLGVYISPLGAASTKKTDPLSIDLTGSVYLALKVKSWIVDLGDRYDKELFKLGLYPKLELLDIDGVGNLTLEEYLQKATPVTRAYRDRVSLQAVTDDYSFYLPEYPYSEPTLFRLTDNRMLLVWVGDNGTKADAERTSILYSIYSNGNWSSPEAVWESGTYQDHPVLVQDGSSVYLAWMQSAESYGNVQPAREQLEKMHLMLSAFREDTSQWSEPKTISDPDNKLVETDYVLAASDGEVAAAWVENSENDLMMNSGTNRIYVYETGNEERDSLYWTDDQITGLSLEKTENGWSAVFSIYADDVTSTYRKDQYDYNYELLEGVDQSACFKDGHLYDIRNTELYQDGEPTGLTGVSNFEILSMEGQTVALTLVPTGFTCELYGSYYDEGDQSWGNWVQMTQFEQYIRGYSATLDEDGRLVAALNLVDADAEAQEVYDNASAVLAVVDDCRYTDLVMSDWISYDDQELENSDSVTLSFEVTNRSREDLTAFTAEILDDHSQVLGTEAISCQLAPGENSVCSIDYALPETITEHEITIRVSPNYTEEETNTANNTATVKIGCADIQVIADGPYFNEQGAYVEVFVKNAGFTAAENSELTMYRANFEGEVLAEASLGTIPAGEKTTYQFQLPDDMMFLEDPDTMHALNVEVTSSVEERELANNEGRVAFGALLPWTIVCGAPSNGTLQLSVTMEENMDDCNIVSALYNNKGQCISVESTEIQGGATKSLAMRYTGQQNPAVVKVFMLDEDYTPLSICWSKTLD